MSQGVDVVGVYVRDQDEALAFYVEKLGFRVHTDVHNVGFRWLTVQYPEPWESTANFAAATSSASRLGPHGLPGQGLRAMICAVAKGTIPSTSESSL